MLDKVFLFFLIALILFSAFQSIKVSLRFSSFKKKTKSKINALSEWQLEHSKNLTMLQEDFDRLVHDKFPELWPEFGIKDPEDRQRYREAAREINVAIQLDLGKSRAELEELSKDAASIEKEQPSRRGKEELKPEQYYEELMEPMVLATYPDQIGSVKRGSLDWIREVLYDLRRKKEIATGLRKEALERAVQFCEALLKRKEADRG